MLYELRTYMIAPGKLPTFLRLMTDHGVPTRGDRYGTLLGAWVSEFGILNAYWHLWLYDSYDERARLRKELTQNAEWIERYAQHARPLIRQQQVRFLDPVMMLKRPTDSGGIYELRIYQTAPSRAAEWAKLYQSYFPMRETYSPCVGLWTVESPSPNEAVHIWHYPDFETRTAIRARVVEDPKWQEFLALNTPMLERMTSTPLLPLPFSPMR